MILSCKSLLAVDQEEMQERVRPRLPVFPVLRLDHSPPQEEKGHHRQAFPRCDKHAEVKSAFLFPESELHGSGSVSESRRMETSISKRVEFPIPAGLANSQIASS